MSVFSASARRVVVAALIPAAIITALALVWMRVRLQPPTLSPYVEARGGDGGEVSLAPDGRFEMDMRPATPVQGAVGARGFLLRGDDVRPWDPPFSVSTDGAVRISGPVNRLFAGVPPGAWEVAVAVGRPEFLPTAPLDVLRARERGPEKPSWHLVRERVRLESSGPHP